MRVNNYRNWRRFGFLGGKSTFSKLIFCIFLGIVFGSAIAYCLITQFYFHQAIVVGILFLPFIIVFLAYSPRQSLLSLLVLTIPFNPCFHVIHKKSFAFDTDLNFWTSDVVVLCIFIYLLISKDIYIRKRHNSPSAFWSLGLPLLLWITAGAISIVPAVDRSISIIELIRMLRIFLIFVAVYKLVDKPEDLRLIVISLIVAFSIQITLVLIEYYAGHPILRLPGEMREADIVGIIFRPSGSMGHSSNFAKFAALCLPICYAFLHYNRKTIGRIGLSVVLIGGLVALTLTVSRAGIVGSLFGLVWVFLLMTKKIKRKHGIVLASLTLLIIGIGLSWLLGKDRLMSRMQEDFGSARSRPQMFSVAWNVIKAHPVIGIGLNNYTLIAPNYDRTSNRISISFPMPVHNIYMLYMAEMGILGVSFFLWFLFGTVLKSFKCSLNARLLSNSVIMKGIGIGITCSWLQGLTGMGFRSSIVHLSYLAIIAGILAALSYYYQNQRVDKNQII